MFSFTGQEKEDKCLAKYSFVRCSIVDRLMEVFVRHLFTFWQMFYSLVTCISCKSAVGNFVSETAVVLLIKLKRCCTW